MSLYDNIHTCVLYTHQVSYKLNYMGSHTIVVEKFLQSVSMLKWQANPHLQLPIIMLYLLAVVSYVHVYRNFQKVLAYKCSDFSLTLPPSLSLSLSLSLSSFPLSSFHW